VSSRLLVTRFLERPLVVDEVGLHGSPLGEASRALEPPRWSWRLEGNGLNTYRPASPHLCVWTSLLPLAVKKKVFGRRGELHVAAVHIRVVVVWLIPLEFLGKSPFSFLCRSLAVELVLSPRQVRAIRCLYRGRGEEDLGGLACDPEVQGEDQATMWGCPWPSVVPFELGARSEGVGHHDQVDGSVTPWDRCAWSYPAALEETLHQKDVELDLLHVVVP
jgi:hypothetical protein